MGENTQRKINEIVSCRDLPPIKKGMRCEVDGKPGVVVGGNSACNLNVKFEGWKNVSNCHPYWRMKIFNEDGSIAYESKS
jgi:hypothetical protein